MRSATHEDRRSALLAAIEAATGTDKGLPIGEAVIKSFRDRKRLAALGRAHGSDRPWARQLRVNALFSRY
jgi:hypothetical protein